MIGSWRMWFGEPSGSGSMADFGLSNHARIRAQQRGLRFADIDFVVRYGSQVRDGYVLSDADAAELESEARSMLETASRLRGIYVPFTAQTVKTVFRANRKQLSRLL